MNVSPRLGTITDRLNKGLKAKLNRINVANCSRVPHASNLDYGSSLEHYVLRRRSPTLSFECALLCLQTSVAEAHCGGLESVRPLPYGKNLVNASVVSAK